MTLSVRDRADAVATFRHLAVHLMETLARWVPATPEMEVKVLFGRHLWVLAQHADAFGTRTAELRLALHASRPPQPEVHAALDALAGAEATGERVDGFYADVIPLLERVYTDYLERVDPLLDEPTIRILEHVQLDLARLRREQEALRREFPAIARSDGKAASKRLAALTSLDAVVDFRPPVPAGTEV